jgi:hypothetical protein
MHKSIPSIVLISIFLAGILSGCGIIGGAFTLPEDDPNYTPGATVAPGGSANGGAGTAVATPLPLQSVTPLPTGIPQLPPDCVDALSVTIDDYGKHICVGGIVKLITMEGGKYRVYFGERGKLYMLGLDWVDQIGLRAGECAYAEGKLSRDGVAAVMPITPYTLKRCPVG